MRQIILASQSPRRKELLEKMGVEFLAVASGYDEQLDDSRSPAKVAEELGLGKALDVAKHHPEAMVIGSDVIVSLAARQLAKPADEADARRMLYEESLVPNDIACSIVLVCLAAHIQEVRHETAKVYFKPFNEEMVGAYLRTGDWKDKAGGYGIQSGAAPLVDHVVGNIDTIMGFPTHSLAPILNKLGVPARPVDVVLPVRITAN